MSDLLAECDWHDSTLFLVLPEDPERIGVRLFPSRHAPSRMYVPKAEIVRTKAENAKLRELCADMYGFIKRMDEDCGDVTFSDCFDYCKHDTADDGCCKTGECWYEQRLRELGIEVGA